MDKQITINEYIATISHEIRTPLNGIIGIAELLQLDVIRPTSPDYKEFLGDILSSARHLLLLIDDILDLAQVDAGKIEFHPETIDLKKFLNDVQRLFAPIIKQKDIQFVIEINPIINEIYFDAARLRQIIYNYVSNALKFTMKGGMVTLRIAPQDKDMFSLEVEDTGMGIREQDLKKLFVEFQQLDTAQPKVYPSTGLGLALTKRIVESLNGKVGVTSIYEKGSTFYAILPRKLDMREYAISTL